VKLLSLEVRAAGCGLNGLEDGNAGKFGFVPICYIKIAACKHPGHLSTHLGNYE
jgi:hypothetical protein